MSYRNDVPISAEGLKELISLINTNYMSVNALVDAETLKMPSTTLPAETDLDNLTVTNRRIKTFVIPSSSATIKTINGIPADYPALAGVLIEYRIDNARKIQAIFPAVNPFKWYYRAKQSTAEGWSGWISSDDALPKIITGSTASPLTATPRSTDNAVTVTVISVVSPTESKSASVTDLISNIEVNSTVIYGYFSITHNTNGTFTFRSNLSNGKITVEFKKVVT